LAEAKRTLPEAEDKFDAYLRERFAELKRELDAQLNAGQPKAGILQKFTPKGGFSAHGGWTVGIAALLLTAISVPLIMQLNQQREQARATVVTSEQPLAARDSKTVDDEFDKADSPKASANEGKVKTRPAKKEITTEETSDAKDAGLAFNKRAQLPGVESDRAAEMADAEEVPARSARVAPAPAAPAATRAPAAEAPAGEMAKTANRDEQMAASEAPVTPEPNTRSAPINDAQFRLKQSELAAMEKAEMEQLWKEYEKNPELFVKDKKKTERLKMLLARHDTKSRARRMRTQ